MRKGRTVYHCHGKEAGKPIHTYATVAKAKAAHRGMVANKPSTQTGKKGK